MVIIMPNQESGDCYEIIVAGQLDSHWVSWFGELTMRHNAAGQTILTATKMDQSKLFGVLAQIRDLGLTLISVRRQTP